MIKGRYLDFYFKVMLPTMKLEIIKYMKNILSILFIVFIGLAISSCSNKSTAPVKDQSELKSPKVGDDIPSEVATSVFDKAPITKEGEPQMGDMEEDCHGKRRVSQTLEEVEGSILKVANKYVISTDGGNSRYNPCELPKKLQKEGILVRFSGEVLEIFAGERLIATPFRLKNIVERDN